jgi:hypothetical protein
MKIQLLVLAFGLTAFVPPPEKINVYIFLSAKCPCVYSHQETVSWLEKKYSENVKFTAIFVDQSNDKEDIEMTMRNLAWKMSYLKDTGGKFMKRFKPKLYTDCVLVSHEGKVLYHGAIDDSPLHMGQVRHSYLEEAIEGYLKNGIVSISHANGVGCMIAGEQRKVND